MGHITYCILLITHYIRLHYKQVTRQLHKVPTLSAQGKVYYHKHRKNVGSLSELVLFRVAHTEKRSVCSNIPQHTGPVEITQRLMQHAPPSGHGRHKKPGASGPLARPAPSADRAAAVSLSVALIYLALGTSALTAGEGLIKMAVGADSSKMHDLAGHVVVRVSQGPRPPGPAAALRRPGRSAAGNKGGDTQYQFAGVPYGRPVWAPVAGRPARLTANERRGEKGQQGPPTATKVCG